MADQQPSNSSSAIARVSSNQPSYSYKSTAAVVGSCLTSIKALVKSFITFKESNLMANVNLSALLVSLSVVVNSVKKVAPSRNMRNKIARASRKAQHRLAANVRRARQAKNGWAKSPEFQALCRKQTRFVPAIPTVVMATKQSVETVVKYAHLSDGQGQLKTAPAVRLHRRTQIEKPITASMRRPAQLKARKTMVLPDQRPVLAKLSKKKTQLEEQLETLAVSPTARPVQLTKAERKLRHAEKLMERLEKEVAKVEKKEERKEKKAGVSASAEIPEIVDTFLEQLEALREAIDVNLYSGVVPESHVQQAEETVADYKATAEATGTADLEMSMKSETVMPVTLEKVEWIEGMLLSINKDNRQAIHNHLKGVRTYKVSFHIPTCTIRGAADYLLSIGFQVNPNASELLWLAGDTVVPEFESPTSKKKEKSKVENKPSNGVTRLENFNENSQQLFVTDNNKTTLHIVLAGKARGKHVLFNKAECTVKGVVEYLLSLKFEIHPDADWLWLDKNLSVKPLGEPRKKKEERKEDDSMQSRRGLLPLATTSTVQAVKADISLEVKALDCSYYYKGELVQELEDVLIIKIDGEPLESKTSKERVYKFQSSETTYPCEAEDTKIWQELGIETELRLKLSLFLKDYEGRELRFYYDTSLSEEADSLLREFGFANSSTNCSEVLIKPATQKPVVCTALVDKDGLKHYSNYLINEAYDQVWGEVVDLLNNPATNKTSFQTNGYHYICLGDYYWVWDKSKKVGEYLTTQPDDTTIKAMPAFLKDMVEHLVNVTFKGIFDGEFVAESCLVNVYQSGNALNYHVDQSEEVDAPIVSLSLGAAGKFNIKDSWQPNAKVTEFTLNKGDLFMFYGKHRKCIHSYAGNIEEGTRINLTVRMVKKPIVKQEELLTVQQTVPQTRKRPTESTQATKPAKEITISTTPQSSVTEVVKMLDPGTTFNELYPVPGLTSLFTFEHTGMSDAEKAKPDEIVIAGSNIRMEDGVFAKCTMNVPSPCIDSEFVSYWVDDVHPKDNNNLLSGGTEPGNKLPYDSSPFNLCVAQYCVNGSTAQFTPVMYASRTFKAEKAVATAGIQIILDMFDAGWFGKNNTIPDSVVNCRKLIREAIETGKSVDLKSFRQVKDREGNAKPERTTATLTYKGERGLAEILKDGKKQTLVTVASFKKDRALGKDKGGIQWRIYPYKVEVFLVEDRDAILGSKNILNFCPYALLGIEALKVQAAITKETNGTKPVTKVQAEKTVEQPVASTEQVSSTRRRRGQTPEVEKAIVAANVDNELEALYKAVNLTFDTLGAPKEVDEEAIELEYYDCGSDLKASKITLEYIFGRTNGNPVQYYSWSPEDVEKVLAVLTARWSKDNEVSVATLSYHMTEEKELNINFGGATAILISNDGRAYDQEGRSFEQAIEVSGYHKISSKEVLVDDKYLLQEVKTPHVTRVKPASSTGKFMQAFCGFLLMLGNNKINVRDGLAANFPQLLREGDDMFPLTLTEVLGQNGGFLHGLQNNMKVLIHRPFNPNIEFTPEQTGRLAHSTAFLMRGEIEKGKSKKMWLTNGETEPRSVTADELKLLLKTKTGQVVKTLKDSEDEVEQAAMLAAMPKYRSLGFHFAKGVFLAGITHVSLALAQERAPNLFARMLLATGLKAEVAADYVVSLTLKASKGAKRATLSMAKAVHVVGEVEAGYKYYNQTKLLKGWLVQECMAPTFVMPPGMALFLGTEEQKPIGYFMKTERLVFADYTAGEKLKDAVTLKGQSIIEHRLGDYAEPTYSFDEITGVHTLKFTEKPVILFGTELAWIPKETGVWGSVEFNKHDKADLAEIRWFEVQTVGKATELAVEYDYYLTHRNPKLRGIIKAMMGQAKHEILYNAMNPDLQALGLGDIKLIAPQDTIKSDMLYSWLQVIGNTLRYSNPEAEAIKKLHEFKEDIHAALGEKANLPYLVIESYSVVAGLYQEMINYFEETFGSAIWMHVAQCGDQGRIMTELYPRKVKAEFGWVDVKSSSNWGAEELALYHRLKAEGKTMGIIAESLDYANNPKQNAIIFVSKDDLVEYYQRSYCFIGAPGAPVYGVELFESSTVAEAVSDSNHMASSVRSFSRMPGDPAAEMFEAAKKLLDAGKESMFMSLVIAGMASGDSFGCSKVVKFISLKDPKKEIDSLSLAPADIAYLKELLAASDIDVTLAHHEQDLFKRVAHCFRDVAFDAAGKKLWLPALLATAALKTEDSSNNMSQKFFRDILVPCLNGVTVTTLEEKRVSGILDKLCDSKKTKQLISAAGNVTGKRIALPNIPTGEIWVLYSSAPNSVCQKLARSGFKIDKIETGEVTVFNHNSRAPLTDGPILKLRIIKEEENLANFYQINADSVGLSPISCAMDLGDFDGDGHYFVQLEGKFEATSFEENVEFLSKLLGYPMFNVFTNEKDEPNEDKDNLNEQYAADHYNIKPWEKVALTLSGTPKSVKSSKVTMTLDKYIDFNQKTREVQTKAVGIAHSIFMWSEHFVDILLAAQKLGIDIDHKDPKTNTGWDWSNAANADLVPGTAAMYEIILGGFSNPAWTVYSKYLKGLKEGERTVARPNLKEFNQDIVALGMAGDKSEGFLKLMLAAHQLFFLEKHGEFCDHILSNGVPTKMAVPQNIKQMLAVALVSFELLRGKFAGFNGVLSDNKNPKATGHKVAMEMARTFLKENPSMIKESLVCYQLNQVIEECDWLLYGAKAEERSGRRAAGEVMPSKLQPHQLEYFKALAAKGIVEVEAETVNVEPVVETVEETVTWVEADILVTEEDDDASTQRYFLPDEEVWEEEGRRYGVYTFHNQIEWIKFLNIDEEQPESIAHAEEFTNVRLVKGRFVTLQRVVATREVEAELPVDIAEKKEAQQAPVSFKSALAVIEPIDFAVFEEPVEIESVVIEETKEEAHSVLKQLVEVKETLPAAKWEEALCFVRGLVAEVNAEAVTPVVVEPAVAEPIVQEAPKQNSLIQSLVSVVNKKHAYDSPEEVRVDGDRESLLGNPFKHDYRKEALRAISVAAYGNYYNLVVYQGVEPVRAAQTVLRGLDNNFHIARVWKKPTRVNFLSAIAQLWNKVEEYGFVEVKCWCSPKQCHLDVVKGDLEKAGSRAVWEASIYVAPTVVEEPITVPELTEAEQNEVDAQEATVVAWDNSLKKPERAKPPATPLSRRSIVLPEVPPVVEEEEKQAPLSIALFTEQKDEQGGIPVINRRPRPNSNGGGIAVETPEANSVAPASEPLAKPQTNLTNILDVTCGVIVQQVNCCNVSGAGLALAIGQKWPLVDKEYKAKEWKLGDVQFVKVADKLYVANVAGQHYYSTRSRQTDFDALAKGLQEVRRFAEEQNLTVYVPHRLGSGLAGGPTEASKTATWTEVQNILAQVIPHAVIVEYKSSESATTVDEQFVAKHPLDGLPSVPGAERNKIKDDAMAAVATQFIGFPAKPGVASSTENYRIAWGARANIGVYTANDVVMVSGSGVFKSSGITEADAAKVFNERYIPLVNKAIAASSKFVVGGCSGVDELLKSYVESKNYSAEWVACSYKGYWLLTPAAPKVTGRARSVVKLDPLAWLTPYIEKLETWTANEVTALVKGLNPEQQQALRLILLGGNYVLTGNAGTGKSHLSSVAVKILKLLGYWIVPVATTGLASMNLQDSQGTINRATGVGKGFDNGAREWSAAQKMVGGVTSDKTKKRFSEVQKGRKYKGVIFLIDEVSMLDTCLGYVISEGLEINQRDEAAANKARKTPIQWLCVGDFKQLEPVGGEMIMNRAVFNHKGEEVIKASLMDKLDMKLINLKQQMRQAEGSEFAQELNLLALGEGHGKHRELENCPLIKGRLKASLDEMPEDALHVFALNDELIEWNRQELTKLKAKGNRSKVYSANISVNDRSYTRASFIENFKPVEENLELVVGAPIRVKQEIKDPSDSNKLPLAAKGSRGVIVALNDDSVDVKLRNGNIIEIGRVDLHAPLDENQIPVGRFNQIPIVLAWAITFHGCQGMTEDKVVAHAYTRKRVRPNDGQTVDVVLNGTEYGAKRPMFQNNAFYVGSSRVRKLEDLYFYTGCDTVDLVTETKEQRNYRASTYRRLMFNSYRTNLHVINWLKEQAVC